MKKEDKPPKGCGLCSDGVTNPYAEFPDPYDYCDCPAGRWWVEKLDSVGFIIESEAFGTTVLKSPGEPIEKP